MLTNANKNIFRHIITYKTYVWYKKLQLKNKWGEVSFKLLRIPELIFWKFHQGIFLVFRNQALLKIDNEHNLWNIQWDSRRAKVYHRDE